MDGPHSFALLEAVSRIFYPDSTLKSVQYAIEKVLRIPTRKITVQQEKAFIAFYKLPTKTLRCRIMVDIQLIAENLDNIKIVLKETDRMQTMEQQHKMQQRLGNSNSNTNENTHGPRSDKRDANGEGTPDSDTNSTAGAAAAAAAATTTTTNVAAAAPTVLKQLNQPPVASVSARSKGKKTEFGGYDQSTKVCALILAKWSVLFHLEPLH